MFLPDISLLYELICALEMSFSGSFSQHHLKYIDRTVDSEVLSINDHQCAKHLELHSLCPLSAGLQWAASLGTNVSDLHADGRDCVPVISWAGLHLSSLVVLY